MRSILRAVVVGAGLLAATEVFAQEQRPGLWEFTSQMQMEGMSIPAQTSRQCLAAKDIADRKQFNPSSGDTKCSMSNFKQSGNQVSFDFACTTPEGKMTGSAKGATTAETTTMEMTSRFTPPIEGMAQVNQRFTGKRLGDCR